MKEVFIMEIKFIVNGKSYSTLCKAVKSADVFSVEVSDTHGYNAFVVVDNPTHMMFLTNINGIDCHREQTFVDYGKTEKGFKAFLMLFFSRVIHDLEDDYHLIYEENVLFHLYKGFNEYEETSSSSEETSSSSEETTSSTDEIEKTLINSAKTLDFTLQPHNSLQLYKMHKITRKKTTSFYVVKKYFF